MTICAFVDPDDVERDFALHLAIAIAEHSVAENRTLYLLCDPITALEIGLALLGARTSRTVEGDEYRHSPIVLLPFLRGRRTSESEEIIDVIEDDGIGGGVEEIYNLGVFADAEERDFSWLPSDEPDEVFQWLTSETPCIIFGLGSNSKLWRTVSTALSDEGMRRDQHIVDIDGFTPNSASGFSVKKVVRNENAYVRREHSEAEDPTGPMEEGRQREEQKGALVAALFEFLSSGLD